MYIRMNIHCYYSSLGLQFKQLYYIDSLKISKVKILRFDKVVAIKFLRLYEVTVKDKKFSRTKFLRPEKNPLKFMPYSN